MSWQRNKKPRSGGTGGGPVGIRFKPPLLVPVSKAAPTLRNPHPRLVGGIVVTKMNSTKRNVAVAKLGEDGQPIAKLRKQSSRVSKKELALLQKEYEAQNFNGGPKTATTAKEASATVLGTPPSSSATAAAAAAAAAASSSSNGSSSSDDDDDDDAETALEIAELDSEDRNARVEWLIKAHAQLPNKGQLTKPTAKKWLQQFEDDAVKLPATKDVMSVKATGVDACSTPASEKSAPDSKRLKVKKKKSSGENGSRGGGLVKRTLAAVENNALPDGMSKVAAGKLVRGLALKAAALATEANALNKYLHPGGGGTNCSLTVTSNEGEQTTSGRWGGGGIQTRLFNSGAANTAGTGDENTAPPPRITIVERSPTVARADATTVQRVVGGAGSGSLERITEQSMLKASKLAASVKGSALKVGTAGQNLDELNEQAGADL